MAEKRYKTEDLFESIEDTKYSWEKNESLGEKKDLKLSTLHVFDLAFQLSDIRTYIWSQFGSLVGS